MPKSSRVESASLLLGLLLLVGGPAGAYVAAGGRFDRATETSIQLLPPGEWGFITMVGCGRGLTCYATTVGPVLVVRTHRYRIQPKPKSSLSRRAS